jgi:glycogen debranching enzyme
VSDRRGDIAVAPEEAQGLFHGDTRFLSRWVLTVNGQRPNPLSTDDVNYFSSQFFLVPGTGTIYVDSPMSIVRQRAVGGGFHEDLKVRNHTHKPIDLDIRIEAAADFADLFQVKDAEFKRKGEFYDRIESNRLVLGYKRERFVRETWITSSASAEIDEKGFRFRVRLEPHGEWSTSLDVSAAVDGWGGIKTKPKYKDVHDVPTPNIGMNLESWITKAPQLRSSWRDLERIYERALVDLAALRFFSRFAPGKALPAAGLPWFMALFGRDSLITSFQALPFLPELAASTLEVLALTQGTRHDDFREEEPGKILHEARAGEMTAFEERPHSPYFGSADSIPCSWFYWKNLSDGREKEILSAGLRQSRGHRCSGSTNLAIATAMATLSMSVGIKKPVSKINAGRTRGTPLSSPTEQYHPSPLPLVRFRGTSTTRSAGLPAWRVSSGTILRLPVDWKKRLPI